MKKWLIGIVCVLILAVAGVLIGLNWNALTSNSQLYTHEQMQESYDKGLSDGNVEREELVFKINLLTSENAELKDKVKKLTPYAEENSQLNSEIQTLNAKIQNLELEIEYYESLIPEVDSTALYYLNFYDGNDFVKAVIVSEESHVPESQIPVVEKWGYIFNGWTLEDGTTIDLTTQTFETNTNLYASFTEMLKLKASSWSFSFSIRQGDNLTTVIEESIKVDGLKSGDKFFIKVNSISFTSQYDVDTYLTKDGLMVYGDSKIYNSDVYEHYIKDGQSIEYTDKYWEGWTSESNDFEISFTCEEDGYLKCSVDYKASKTTDCLFFLNVIEIDWTNIYVDR